ncbi:MAG: hypothetical protein JW891_08430 [Candidatus Lokiarchaeota archaeon]|nr:hypothetical protein [Candidatus Lokiarchaeota archaeon]
MKLEVALALKRHYFIFRIKVCFKSSASVPSFMAVEDTSCIDAVCSSVAVLISES